MTTASTNVVIDQTSDAAFRTWIQEILTNLITNCGLTQASDTGQITSSMGPPVVNVATTRPAANTSAGYVILNFNDTLQGSAPIFIKLEFGSASVNTSPQMWITVGTATNGAGTLSGTGVTLNSSQHMALCNGSAPASTVTNYTSRYCYNATQGVLWMGFKLGGTATGANAFMGGFMLARTVNNAGAPTATGASLLVNNIGTAGTTSGNVLAAINYSLSTATQFGNNGTGTSHLFVPGKTLTSLEGSSANIFPCFQYAATASAAGYGITNVIGMVILGESAMNSTFTATILGTTSLTYLVGGSFGSSTWDSSGMSLSISTYGMAFLWQ